MKLHLVVAAFGTLALITACAGSPEAAAGTFPVTCELLSSRDVSFLSTTRATNPFMPVAGVIRGSDDEFAVLRIRLALPQPMQVFIDGSARDDGGADVAQLQTLEQMRDYWNRVDDDIPYRDARAKADTLQRLYPPGFSFTAKKGRSEYVVVLKGKNPMPRPATVILTVTLGDGEPQEFTFPLPSKQKDLLGR